MSKSINSNSQTESDGVIDRTTAYQAHEGRMYVEKKHNEKSRAQILQLNADIRRETPLTPEFMATHKLALSIPQGDLPVLQKRFPDIMSDNMRDKARAYKAVAAAYPEYIQYQKR